MANKRDTDGLKFRLRFRPDEDGNSLSNNLSLASIASLKKKASRQERTEYEDFIPHFKEIFHLLDSTYVDGEY